MLRHVSSNKQLTAVRAKLQYMAKWCGKHLNFFRVHVLVFTFTPLIAAAIFYACNGENHIKFIDSLFVCVSAMTVTGLVTINISTANGGQQAILFILMCIGNISAVSVTMIWIRRSFFRKKFDHVVRRSAKVRKRMHDVEEQERRERRRNIAKLQRMVGLKSSDSATTMSDTELDRTDSSSSDHIELRRIDKNKQKTKNRRGPLRADMIRRIDGPAFLINSAGDPSNTIPEQQAALVYSGAGASVTREPDRIGSPRLVSAQPGVGILTMDRDRQPSVTTDEHHQQPSIRISLPHDTDADRDAETSPLDQPPRRRLSIPRFDRCHDPDADSDEEEAVVDGEDDAKMQQMPRSQPLHARFPDHHIPGRGRRVSDPPQSHVRRGSDTGLANTYATQEKVDMFPRSQTVEFVVPSDYRSPSDSQQRDLGYTTGNNISGAGGLRQRNTTMDRTITGRSYVSGRLSNGKMGIPLARTQTSSKQRGFGGFPTPLEIASMAIKKAVPGVQERFQRTMTMPRTATFTSIRSGGGLPEGGTKAAPYLSFDATVTGNSRFHALTEAQRDELGGVEYRALDLLAKLVPAYWLIVNLTMVTMVAPYINSSAFTKYRVPFDMQGAEKPNYTWFWFFQVISAYSNTGMSLVDTSMTQMRDAYFLLIPMGFLILAGNTGFPILLRFFIWIISVCVPSTSRIYETLRFLLDHPRRCFVYLFPSSQTWFLFFVLVIFNVTDWLAFLILDIGNPVIEQIKLNVRIFDGLFQSIAVRAAGFTVVSLLALAPAVQFLYVIMMYLSAFPLALSVRSTNVYEEKSLGVYVDEQPTEPGVVPQESNDAKVWGSFLASHARRQLAFDIWWLGFALWLICIIERNDIQDASSNGWFTIFSCLFELTSAYGTVGLSLGTPYDNFSLSGRFHTLSKLVVCAVMIRGRHRGLPVAIDRAILLPSELEAEDMLDDDFSHIDDMWDRDTTLCVDPNAPVGPGAPRSSFNAVDRQRSNSSGSGDAVGENNGMSSVKRTGSGVSFAVNPAGTRRNSMPMEPLSPKHMAENGSHEPRRSFTFTLPPSSLPLLHGSPTTGAGGVTGPMMVSSPGQLTAIDEMPSGNGATPMSESRAESPCGVGQPPSLQTNPSASPNPSTNSSVKGKEKEKQHRLIHSTTCSAAGTSEEEFEVRQGKEEREVAQHVGCSTPDGKHDPVTGNE
ncbi:related to potassium transporter TRK-1 [Melanopsichium pennsylvanicum]|uniref:Related to potassium transporter TRK-1 n=2 Tax=Melanopsichium pennsylvanicum TaxID=63383 RepID=A0AAJ4XKL5_9BASI|nr:related to potassium transporter TRK-1 [Melanopsichium pennsylvanicum 4]SNX84022.1 related to potassium transporter TRK-1 [Melanopsichium pennsylvanicum]